MAIALPIVVDSGLTCTGFIAGYQNDMIAIVTTLHSLGNGTIFEVGIPPHGGDISLPQNYPIFSIPTLPSKLVICEPLLDLAILLARSPYNGQPALLPRYISRPSENRVGEEMLIVGYPYIILGSFLETVEFCRISALGNRLLSHNTHRHEFVVSHQAHLGSSGSPVVRRTDGIVCGVLRGSLAPPPSIAIGKIPIGGDSTVTFVTSAHIIPELLTDAFSIGAI